MKKHSKLDKLRDILGRLDSVMVAFSGGVDSTFLAKVAQEVLGEKAIAATIKAPVFSTSQFRRVKELAKDLSLKHIIVDVDILADSNFRNNTVDRCYFCKKIFFEKLKEKATEKGIKNIIDGTNADDLKSFRPGRKALQELKILSPLAKVDLTKAEIRKYSRDLGLATAFELSSTCLATRFPYGVKITKDGLKQVELAENFLHELGFAQCRVRHYGEIVRIEVERKKLRNVFRLDTKQKIVDKFKKLGYIYVTIDLEGYRTGSMDEVLSNA